MRLAIVSHKICRKDPAAASGYATDGGFPRQIEAISELFDETVLVVPCGERENKSGLTPLEGKNLKFCELSVQSGKDFRKKLLLPFWLLRNGRQIWKAVKSADAVHAPIPGDVGTIGLVFALVQKKPLFVRHCGNWLVQRTAAERFWKWLMERFAGGRNVMFATGGNEEAPSRKNPHVKWIFSTSLRQSEMAGIRERTLPADGRINLLIACRQEERKGTGIVIESLKAVLRDFPLASLHIAGDGALLESLKKKARALGVEDKVIFYGKIERTRVIELMKKCHVFCFPTSASEGFPKAVIEALACGLPVVTTRVSVLPQIIADGGNGHLLARANAEGLAAAVREICGDGENYRAMSRRALETARAYSLENWRDTIGENLRRAWNVPALSGSVQKLSLL